MRRPPQTLAQFSVAHEVLQRRTEGRQIVDWYQNSVYPRGDQFGRPALAVGAHHSGAARHGLKKRVREPLEARRENKYAAAGKILSDGP